MYCVNPDKPRAERYRERASELRTIANGVRDPENRKLLVAAAESYERMAVMYGDDAPLKE